MTVGTPCELDSVLSLCNSDQSLTEDKITV